MNLRKNDIPSFSRQFCWEVTILILKKLGRRYVLGKLPSGRLFFLDKMSKELVEIPKSQYNGGYHNV